MSWIKVAMEDEILKEKRNNKEIISDDNTMQKPVETELRHPVINRGVANKELLESTSRFLLDATPINAQIDVHTGIPLPSCNISVIYDNKCA